MWLQGLPGPRGVRGTVGNIGVMVYSMSYHASYTSNNNWSLVLQGNEGPKGKDGPKGPPVCLYLYINYLII